MWRKQTYPGTHPTFVSRKLFDQVQTILDGHNRPKYSKREIAFRGLMNCAYDGCMVTGEIQKENTFITAALGIAANVTFRALGKKTLQNV